MVGGDERGLLLLRPLRDNASVPTMTLGHAARLLTGMRRQCTSGCECCRKVNKLTSSISDHQSDSLQMKVCDQQSTHHIEALSLVMYALRKRRKPARQIRIQRAKLVLPILRVRRQE